MKLLYMSVHSILEYDEISLFEELGIDYFSLGSYIDPQQPVDPIRPPLKQRADSWLIGHAPLRHELTKEFIDKFDTVVIMHGDDGKHNWIIDNIEVLKGKRVIWRTIGQSTPALENKLAPHRKHFEIVRYSPREQGIAGNIGFDAMIRFYKDPKEFKDWVGGGTEVITFAQNMRERAEYCQWDIFKQVAEGFNAHVYGPKNESAKELNGGFLEYQQLKQKMRDARAYIYTGTQPACYTLNFIEAMMTGIPIVAVGPKWGDSLHIAGDMYEIPDIINNGVNGFWDNDVSKLRQYVSMLVKDVKFARMIGKAGRETAIKLFGKEVIKSYWKRFLKV